MRSNYKKDSYKQAGEYARRRDAALIKFVEAEDETDLLHLFREYGGKPAPKQQKVRFAAYYKMIQYCTAIPDEIKQKAMQRCISLGFNPLINWGDVK